MVAIRYESPLKLPKNWELRPTSKRGYNPNFPRTLTFAEAVRYFEDEVHRLEMDSAICYSNYANLNNERLRKKVATDSAISLLLKLPHGAYFIACDKWLAPEQNLYALHLTLRALLSLEEWGTLSVRHALHSFPASGTLSMETKNNELPKWMKLLGIGPTASLDDAHVLYRHKVKQCGNNQNELMGLNLAMDEARRSLD